MVVVGIGSDAEGEGEMEGKLAGAVSAGDGNW